MATTIKLITVFAFVLTAGVTTSCNGTPARNPDLRELQRLRSGDLEIVLLSDDGTLAHGMDTITLEFRRGNDLVDVGKVKAGATMPMAGLPAMLGSVFMEPGDTPGRYKAETDLSMSGGWNLTLDWNGPAGRGTVKFVATAE